MKPRDPDTVIPTILLVDDEQPIHSALKLRLGESYRVISVFSPREALGQLKDEPLDLCIVDIQMPGMNGLAFIEAAREIDPALGYLIFSGFDSDENLRKAIPLQVFDFIPKPLPERSQFEKRLPDWIDRTRARRRELAQAKNTDAIVRDLELARIESAVESTASESAREALFQTAGILTTAQALLLNATHLFDSGPKSDPRLSQAVRSLQEARHQVETAAAITDEYFASAYADRDSSPALVDLCTRHAIAIGSRRAATDERRLLVDHQSLGRETSVSGLTGIEFLVLLVPPIVQALKLATDGSTTRIQCSLLARLDEVHHGIRGNDFIWINRRNARLSNPGVLLSILTNAVAPTEPEAAAWLRGQPRARLQVSVGGLISGIQKCKGLAGVSIHPHANRFEVLVALPI
jgi:CheY-like chemotaxis protein